MNEYEKDERSVKINKPKNERRKKDTDLIGNGLLLLSEKTAKCLKPKTLLVIFSFSFTAWIGYSLGLNEQQSLIRHYEQKIYQLEVEVKKISVLKKKIELQEENIFELRQKNKKLIEILLENKKE